MKRMIRNVQAASDFRTFDGYSIDEVLELFPEIYEYYLARVSDDIDRVYIPRHIAKCEYIGVLDTEGQYYVWEGDGEDGPGWYEVTFEELADLLY